LVEIDGQYIGTQELEKYLWRPPLCCRSKIEPIKASYKII